MHQLGEIGSFQFENLARSRVPFQLILIGVDVPGDMDHDLLRPVWAQASSLPESAETQELIELIRDRAQPLVIAAREKSIARSHAAALNEMDYFNCYFLGIHWSELEGHLRSQFSLK